MPACAAQPDSDFGNHIIMTVQINGQDAHLVFDTGAETTVLFRKSADRLGVKTIDSLLAGRLQIHCPDRSGCKDRNLSG